MVLDKTNFGVYSKSNNRELINKFLTAAHSLGWKLQGNSSREGYWFTISEGKPLKANHYWYNPVSYLITCDKAFNLDTDYGKAKYMLQIIGKRFNTHKYNTKNLILKIKK